MSPKQQGPQPTPVQREYATQRRARQQAQIRGQARAQLNEEFSESKLTAPGGLKRASRKVGDSPVLPLLLMGAGLYLMWFGVKYWRDQDAKWPSDPVKSILQGKGLPKHTESATVTEELATAIQTAQAEAPSPTPGGGASPKLPASGAYSESQLESIWKLAGGNPAKASFAAGVAGAESGGRPKVTSANPDGGTNVGLWQLDTKGKGTGYTIAQLQNPATNAKVTVAATSNGTDWSAWADPFISAHGTSGNIGTTNAPGPSGSLP